MTGVQYTKDIKGRNRYIRFDMQRFKHNNLLEDFLDLIDVENRKDEPVYDFDNVISTENHRRGINV